MKFFLLIFFYFYTSSLFGQQSVNPFLFSSISYRKEIYKPTSNSILYSPFPTINKYFSFILGLGIEIKSKVTVESSFGYTKIAYSLFQTNDIIKLDLVESKLVTQYNFLSNKKINPQIGFGLVNYLNMASAGTFK